METETIGKVGTFTVPADRAHAFGRALVNVAAVRQCDKARPLLGCIHVQSAGGSVTFTATDSYRAMRATFDGLEDSGEWATILDGEHLAACGTQIGKTKGAPVVWSGVVERPGSVVVSVGANPVLWSVDSVPGTYPDTDTLFTRAETDPDRWPNADVETVGVNPDLLAGLLSAMKKTVAGKRSDLVRVDLSRVSGNRAWRLTATGDAVSVVAILMPMR